MSLEISNYQSDLKKVSSHLYNAVLIALCCTCLVTSKTITLGIINAKILYFLILIGFALILTAINLMVNWTNFKFNKLDLLICCFFLFIIANDSIHERQILSINTLVEFGLIILYFFGKIAFSDTKFNSVNIEIFLLVICLSQICVPILQWYQIIPSYNSNFKFTGVFFNPAPFAIFLSCFMVACLVMFLFEPSKCIKTVCLILLMSGIPIILIAMSRSAWLALLASSFFVIIVRFKENILDRQLPFKRMIIIVFMISLVLLIPLSRQLYNLKRDSADGRLLTWKISFNIASDQLLCGIGSEHFADIFLKYQSNYFYENPTMMKSEGRLADQVTFAFNDLLQILVEQGIIGLFLFLAIIGLLLKYFIILFKRSDIFNTEYSLLLIAVGILLVVLISGVFSYPLKVLPIQVLFYVSLSYVSTRFDGISSHTFSYRNSKWITKTVLLVSLSLLSIGYLCISVDIFEVYRINNILEEGNYRNNKLLMKITKYQFLFHQEVWFQILQCDKLLNDKNYSAAIIFLKNAEERSSDPRLYYTLGNLYMYKKQYRYAENQYLFLYYALPNLMGPKYTLAKFYFDTNQLSKWKTFSQLVLHFIPKTTSGLTIQMQKNIEEIGNVH